ncbi:MAG: F0F1 ATP synthase subunit alpha [Thermoanaerobaculia bacterium]|nr:MAG: F0F1 ATP synthase subunit alpha [Thermoanaerobaculia bacterium]MBZ0102752.1 F0F1 ATP synthase subunit alpha [Thermoanaerobaculia bacterium]
MKFRVDEISSVIAEEIRSFRTELDLAEVGKVLEVGDGIARVYGLSNAMSSELVQFANGAYGQVFNLEESSVGVVILGDFLEIKEGDEVRRTGELLSVPCGEAMIGRIVDPLGRPLDGKGVIETPHRRPLEYKAPGIAQRQPVTEPLQTGIKAIDSMIPIGRGQRELIIGDRKTGKTAIAIDAIINQKGTGVICVYVAIGMKESTVVGIVEKLREVGAMDYTIVISAGSSDPAPLQYIAPYAGAAMAEYFMYGQGRATLCVYDDLTKQAAAYRQLSLLLRRPPGREAYPGDVFYLHSRLLERAVKLREEYAVVPKDLAADSTDRARAVQHPQGLAAPEDQRPDDELGLFHRPHGRHRAEAFLATLEDKDAYRVHRFPDSGGSMTALPIIETLEGEVSAYIPTNVISITDGQIYLEPDLFFAGVRPAVNVGISVSRVGGNAQRKAMKKIAGTLRLDLASFRSLEAFAQLGTDLDAATQKQLDRGKRMVELLKQPQYRPYDTFEQVVSIFAGTQGVLDDLPIPDVLPFETDLLTHVRNEFPEILEEMRRTGDLPGELSKRLLEVLTNFKAQWLKRAAEAVKP